MSTARLWAMFLLVVQVANAIAFALTAMAAVELPAPVKEKVLYTSMTIAAVVGAMQAFAKSLTDRDKDGTPDLFDGAPDDPSKAA